MKAYYDRRAPEYDDVHLGTGLFADRERPGWHEDVPSLREVVASLYKRLFEPEALAAELGGGRVLYSGSWFVVVQA